MKLSSKYNLVNAIAIISIVLVSAVCYYFLISSAFNHQLNKDIYLEELAVRDNLKNTSNLPEARNYRSQQEEFSYTTEPVNRRLSDTTIFDKAEKENQVYRQLEFNIIIGGRPVKAVIRKSKVETEDLLDLIMYSTLAIVIALVLSLLLLHRFILHRLWEPFYSTVRQLRKFNLAGQSGIKFQPTQIDEFRDLNTALETMIRQINHDYLEIRQFTENASHEIQTPLAIIKSKLELLTQSEHLDEENMTSLQSIYDATSRLSKLNQSLILLTKIDNQQFQESKLVNMAAIINRQLENYEELIEAKGITVSKSIYPDLTLKVNETLAEILISNLLTNAIKHNSVGGIINIVLSRKDLVISNTGVPLATNPVMLFERFRKDQVTSESLGLGLSIVMRICEVQNLRVTYENEENIHRITVFFRND